MALQSAELRELYDLKVFVVWYIRFYQWNFSNSDFLELRFRSHASKAYKARCQGARA